MRVLVTGSRDLWNPIDCVDYARKMKLPICYG
jgi:hypothetical protein